MTMPEGLRRWWKWHEGWVAAFVVAGVAFCFGWTASSIHDQSAMAKMSVAHAKDMQRLSDAYREALRSKDVLISRMANQTADAANSSAQAAEAAAKAANKATSDKKTLKKLR